MAAERQPAGDPKEARMGEAFRRFVELVKPIEDVHHVVALDEGEVHVFAYITRLDDAVSHKVYEAEFQVLDEFRDLPIDFHVRYLEGRPLPSTSSPLTYYREDSRV